MVITRDESRDLPVFNPAMLCVAREAMGLTQKDLAHGTEIPQGTISKLESGMLLPTASQRVVLSQRLHVPEPFFYQTDPVYPFGSSTFYHRKQSSLTATVLKKIQARINIYRFHVVRLLRATDLEQRGKFRRFESSDYGGKVKEIANLVRAHWRLRPGPLPDLIRAIEDAGGIVIRFDFETNKLFGVSEWIPPCPPLFFLNTNPEISADRDRFTLAHELGHIFLHSFPAAEMEKEADAFAGEFLMPERDIRSQLHPPLKLIKLVELKRHWKVSIQSLIETAFRLGVINDRQRQYLWMQLSSRGYRLREPVEIAREQPTLLRDIISAHFSELGYTTADLSRMLNIFPDQFKSWYLPEENKLRLVKA